ncbi:adenylate cyclase, class-I family protein, partial [Vibrio parahaemolyticus V-223/04]
CCRAK